MCLSNFSTSYTKEYIRSKLVPNWKLSPECVYKKKRFLDYIVYEMSRPDCLVLNFGEQSYISLLQVEQWSMHCVYHIYTWLCSRSCRMGPENKTRTYILALTCFVNSSTQAMRIRSQVAGLFSLKRPVSPLSNRAAVMASLMAKNTDAARNNGGSPTA